MSEMSDYVHGFAFTESCASGHVSSKCKGTSGEAVGIVKQRVLPPRARATSGGCPEAQILPRKFVLGKKIVYEKLRLWWKAGRRSGYVQLDTCCLLTG
jgi:hypothetical protein